MGKQLLAGGGVVLDDGVGHQDALGQAQQVDRRRRRRLDGLPVVGENSVVAQGGQGTVERLGACAIVSDMHALTVVSRSTSSAKSPVVETMTSSAPAARVASASSALEILPITASVGDLCRRTWRPTDRPGPDPRGRTAASRGPAGAFAFTAVKERSGLAAMEALAEGVPLVIRDLPVLREVFGPAARFATSPQTPARRARPGPRGH